jgi:hypothetical protein
MQIYVIHVNSSHSCQFMSFTSIHVIHVMCHSTFLEIQLSAGEGGRLKYVFLGRRPKAKNGFIMYRDFHLRQVHY